MLKTNRKSSVILSVLGSLLSLGALLIFMLLPTSEFANSVYHSAKDALYVFLLSPVLSFIGSAFILGAYIKDFKNLTDTLMKSIAVSGAVLYSAIAVFNIATFAAYTAEQFSLGFVAPFSGTVYENLAVAAVIGVFHQILLTVLTVVSAKKEN